jgi:hypothetical protein
MTTKRAADALRSAGIPDTPSALRALVIYAAQNPGFEWANYWTGDRAQSMRLYRSDYAQASKGWRDVRTNARICASVGVTDADIIEACGNGRVQVKVPDATWNCYSVEYCTGQYFPVEYRRAIARVLDDAATIAFARTKAWVAA